MDITLSAYRAARQWSDRKEKWIKKRDSYRDEKWEARVKATQTKDGWKISEASITPGIADSSEKYISLEPSKKDVKKAGGIESWIENELEKELREDRQWEDANPKAAKKRKKADKKRRKKEEEIADRSHRSGVEWENRAWG